MDKLKTFLIYLLLIIGFFFLSEFLSGELLKQMYVNIQGEVSKEFEYLGNPMALDVEVLEAKATRMNGYIKTRVTNNTSTPIDKAYLKIDTFANKDVKAISRYLEIDDLKPGESKDYTLKFRAGYVDSYKIAIKENNPDEKYTFEVLGYEFNTKNFLGIDISNYIDAEKIKASGFNGINSIFSFFGKVGHRFVIAVKSVPWWGYLGALAVIGGII